jgi:CheY-like chemotaxis protein
MGYNPQHTNLGGEQVPRDPLRIIVADDNVDSADAMADCLRLRDCEVIAVYEALDIVPRAVEFTPHIVFLDIVMPKLDGYEVVRQLRATPSLADIKIVAWTGLARDDDKIKGLDAGFDGYLVKPTEPVEIYRLIDDLLKPTDER